MAKENRNLEQHTCKCGNGGCCNGKCKCHNDNDTHEHNCSNSHKDDESVKVSNE